MCVFMRSDEMDQGHHDVCFNKPIVYYKQEALLILRNKVVVCQTSDPLCGYES